MGILLEHSGYFLHPPFPPLYGTLFRPDTPPVGSALLLAAFAEERKCVVRTLVLAARALAAQGFAVLRLDAGGTGESAGRHADATLRRWTAEAETALKRLRQLAPDAPAAILGIRLGANLAARAARQIPETVPVLIEPILHGKDYLRDLQRRKQIKEMMAAGKAKTGAQEMEQAWESGNPVDFDGFEIGPELARELRNLDLAADLAALPETCPAALLRVGAMNELPRAWRAAAGAIQERNGVIQIIRAKPFWGRIEYYEPWPVIEEAVRTVRQAASSNARPPAEKRNRTVPKGAA